MKNLITYLKALWGAWGNLQSKDISLDRRLTVGSPSGLDAKWMLKLVSVLVLILTIGSGNVWGATATLTQAEIQAATAQASYPSSEVSVSSASGTWHGKMIINTSTGFVQIRKNNANNYCGSPTFPGGVTQVVITTCNSTSASRIFYLKANTNTAQPTSGDYGSGSTGSSVNGTATITVTGAPTSFYIYANGAAYISSITVTYTAAATAHTVRFYTASGTYTDLTEASAEAGVTPPTMSTPCDGWAFQGWSKSQSTSSTSTTVLTTETLSAGKYYPSSDVTLYPVYTKTEGGGTTWTKMTTNPVAGDVVILVNEGSNVEGKDKTQTKYITTQTYTEAPAGLLPFTVEAGSPSGLSFKNGTDYLQYNGSNNELNQSTTKNNKSSWTVSVAANGTATITNVASTSRVIKYNSSSPRFACYTSGQQSIQLYKQTASSTTYYYSYPTCCTELATINGSFSFTSVGTTGATANWGWTGATTGISKNILKVYKESDNSLVATIDNISASATSQAITGLDPCTEYYVKLSTVSSGGGYCDGVADQTGASHVTFTTSSYTVTKTGVTNVTAASLSAIPATTCASGFGPITIEAASGYVLPATITVTGATGSWTQATGSLTISSVTGNVSITITPTAASCASFSFHTGTGEDATVKTTNTTTCFSQVNSSTTWKIDNYVIPADTKFFVGDRGFFYDDNLGSNNSRSAVKTWSQEMFFEYTKAYGDGYRPTVGQATGAIGTLYIWSDNNWNNLHVGFSPQGYVFKLGSANLAMSGSATLDADRYWETSVITLTSTDISGNYQTNLYTGSAGGVASNNTQSTAVNTMGVKTNAGDNWRGTAINDGTDANTRGFFRIDIGDGGAKNWHAHWVPTHRVVFHPNYPGGGGEDQYSVDVSVEETNNSIALASAPSAPTGYTFAGWYDAADGGNHITTARTISAGASANVELWAHWTANTISLTLNKNTEDAGSNNGSGTIVFDGNATATITGATRTGHTVEGYYTDAACTAANKVLDASGNVINSTVSGYTTSGKWTRATATTLYTKWTPTNYTVDWYVGGSAEGNKLTTGSQSTSVAYGSRVTILPTTPDGSPCDKTFVGWTNTTSYSHGPSVLFTDAASSPVVTGYTQYYAVFATENSVSASLTKMTADDDLEVGDKIVIIAQDTRYGMYQASASSYVSYWTTADGDGEPSLSEIEADDKKYLDVAAGSASNTWKLGDATNGYLYNASSTNLEFSTINSSDLTLITWTDDSFTFVAGQEVSCRTDITGANANKWRGAGASCDPETGDNCSGTPYYYLYKYVPSSTTATGHTITCADCGTSVTVSYSAPGSGNTMTVTKSAAAVASGTVIKTCSAQELTITLTHATHYTADGLTATGVAGVTTSNVGNVYTVTIPAAGTGTLTLTPTFTPETPLSITFIPTVSGATVGSIGTIYSGDDFDFPSVSNLPGGFCADFLGWVDFTGGETFDGDGTRTTAPSELITAGTNSGAITTDKTYKAVYGESETSEAEGYFKVTAAPEAPATWADNHYLIVYEGDATHDAVAFDGSLGTLDATSDGVAVTITSGSIPYSNTLAASEFRIAAITGGYSIQSASGVYIGKEAYSNGLDESTTDAAVNTIAYTSGATVITGVGGCALKYNYASDQLRFRYYKTGQQDIQLYKYGTAPVVTYTYTTAPSCGDKYRVTVESVSGGSPSASPKYCADGTTISLVANPANGYSFTSWTITKDGTNPLQDVTSTLLGANSTTANTSFTMPAYDVTVTAAYSITNYNITYNNLNGATNSNPATYNVTSADIEFVAPGARAGYIFKGWYDDAVYTNQVTGIPNGSTGAVTVYAKWAVGYTITWDNAIGVNPASTGVESGQAIGTLPVPTGSCSYDGTTYSNFVGWYTGTISGVGTAASDAGTEVTGATTPGSDVTYHAVYTNMADYSGTNTSNVTLPASPSSPVSTAKIKVSSEDDAPEYDGIKIGTSKNKTGSFTFTVPSGTTKITLQGAAWSGKTASVTLSTSVGTITPNTAQSLDDNSGASDNSPFTITSNTTLTFNLANVSSEATITVANSDERVIVWGINASSASGDDVGYITSCCDNLLAAPTMNSPTVRTSTAITLSWNTVPNATGYKVSWNGGNWEDVGTATTYEKTSLEPGNDYSYKIIAKYTSPYCGAATREGVVSTKPVFTVTYLGGSGTGTCNPDHVPTDANTYEEGATVTLPPTSGDGNIHLTGNSFAAWSSEQVALTAESTTFTMPAENVTVTATWTANQDKYYDNMHNLTATDPATGDPGTADGAHYYIVREGCNYTVPSLTNSTTGDTDCHTTHYVLMGWAAASHIQQTGENAGQLKPGDEHRNAVFTGGGTKSATGATYYAIWAIVE